MNFTSLDYFIALVQEKSYTKAAQRLHVTQQMVKSCYQNCILLIF